MKCVYALKNTVQKFLPQFPLEFYLHTGMQSCMKLSFGLINGVHNIGHIYDGLYSKRQLVLFIFVCIKNKNLSISTM